MISRILEFLYQFLETGTSETDRTNIGHHQLLTFLGFSQYLFHFTLTIPLTFLSGGCLMLIYLCYSVFVIA